MASTVSLVISESRRKSQRKPAVQWLWWTRAHSLLHKLTVDLASSIAPLAGLQKCAHILDAPPVKAQRWDISQRWITSANTHRTCQILRDADRNVFILLLQADRSWKCVHKCLCLYLPNGKPDRSFWGTAWPVSSSNYAFWNSHKRQKHRPARAHRHIHTGWQR